MRSGPSRRPARSDHAPLPSRPAAPSTWVSASSAPAVASAMPAPECSTSTRNTEPRNWGTTSSRPARLEPQQPAVGHDTRRRSPRPGPVPGRRPRRLPHPHATASATTRQAAASAANTAGIAAAGRPSDRQCDGGERGPERHRGLPHRHGQPAPGGSGTRSAPPARWPRSRWPRPRRRAAAARRPGRARLTVAAPPSASAAPIRPTAITPRSPNRSVALPQAIRVATRPTEITPISAPTPAR